MGNVCTLDSTKPDDLDYIEKSHGNNIISYMGTMCNLDATPPKKMRNNLETKEVIFQNGPMGLTFDGNKIIKVIPDSQADRAGIFYGWRILEVNGMVQTDNTGSTARAIDKTFRKDLPTKVLFQKGLTKKVIFTSKFIGITYVDAVITKVIPDSQAANAGVNIGWVIIRVNDETGGSLSELRITQAIEKNKKLGKPNVIVFYQDKETNERILREAVKRTNVFLSDYRLSPTAKLWNLEEKCITNRACLAICDLLVINSTVTELNLRGNEIGEIGASALGVGLKFNSTLLNIILNENDICGHGATALATGLKINSGLQKLSLFNNRIGDSGLLAFGKALMKNNAMRRLYLKNNEVGDAGVIEFTQSLKMNCALNQLYLQANQISDSGAQAIGQYLKVNSTLALISLKSNMIADEGAIAIAEGLAQNSTLTLLSIPGNKIGDAGAQAIGASLKSNLTLEELYLYKNKIGDRGAEGIADGLRSHPKISIVDILLWNKIGNKGESALQEVKKKNLNWKELK